MKKIAILVTSKSKPGGVERRFINLYKHISNEKKANVKLISFDTLLSEFYFKIDDVISIKKESLFKLSFQILNKFKKEKISHLHMATNPSLLTLALHILCRTNNISSSISVVDSSKVKKEDFNFFATISHKASYIFANKIDFLSDDILSVHKKIFYINDKKVLVSPCSFLSPDLKKIEKDTREYDICFVSRLVPLKGFELFLEALIDIKKPLKVKICGAGELEEYFESLSVKLSHHHIDIGYCKKTDEVYTDSKVFVSLQKYNNYPSQSLLEAIFQGCAIIATDVGETRKILNDENSILIHDKKELVESIEILVNDNKKRELLASKVNQEVFKVHNIENFTKYFLEKVVEV